MFIWEICQIHSNAVFYYAFFFRFVFIIIIIFVILFYMQSRFVCDLTPKIPLQIFFSDIPYITLLESVQILLLSSVPCDLRHGLNKLPEF